MQPDRIELAKRRYTKACEAYLRGDEDAAERCQRALAELEAARREQPNTSQQQRTSGSRRRA